jgi:hypothetical protein
VLFPTMKALRQTTQQIELWYQKCHHVEIEVFLHAAQDGLWWYLCTDCEHVRVSCRDGVMTISEGKSGGRRNVSSPVQSVSTRPRS